MVIPYLFIQLPPYAGVAYGWVPFIVKPYSVHVVCTIRILLQVYKYPGGFFYLELLLELVLPLSGASAIFLILLWHFLGYFGDCVVLIVHITARDMHLQ